MRISDWSSDVCSSDLGDRGGDHRNLSDLSAGPKWAEGPGDRGGARCRRHLVLEPVSGLPARHRKLCLRLFRAGRAHVRLELERTLRRSVGDAAICASCGRQDGRPSALFLLHRSEEHTSELQSLMRISYAVFCLTKNKTPLRTT